jgi:hypothetical protein
MANTGVSHGEVKSICDGLECSPSASSPGSSLYEGKMQEPEAHAHKPKHSAGAKGHMTNSESGFGKKGSSLRRNIAAGKAADTSKKV